MEKRKFGKRIGMCILTISPLFAYILLQVAVSGLSMLVLVRSHGEEYLQVYNENIPAVMMATQLVGIFAFSLWYRKGFGNDTKPYARKKRLGASGVGLLILLGVGIQCIISAYLSLFSSIFPRLMQEYEILIEESGIAELTVFTMIATLILAPIEEELIFRGVTMRFARAIGGGFWLANFIQAVLFGIAHMNFVQGIYAGILGILLGYVAERFQSLYAAMLLHLIFNFLGTVVSPWMPAMGNVWLTVLAYAAAGGVITAAAVMLIRRKTAENGEDCCN